MSWPYVKCGMFENSAPARAPPKQSSSCSYKLETEPSSKHCPWTIRFNWVPMYPLPLKDLGSGNVQVGRQPRALGLSLVGVFVTSMIHLLGSVGFHRLHVRAWRRLKPHVSCTCAGLTLHHPEDTADQKGPRLKHTTFRDTQQSDGALIGCIHPPLMMHLPAHRLPRSFSNLDPPQQIPSR